MKILKALAVLVILGLAGGAGIWRAADSDATQLLIRDMDTQQYQIAYADTTAATGTVNTVTTGLSVVYFAHAQRIDVADSTATGTILVAIPDQSVAANRGNITVQVAGASGTTNYRYFAIGL